MTRSPPGRGSPKRRAPRPPDRPRIGRCAARRRALWHDRQRRPVISSHNEARTADRRRAAFWWALVHPMSASPDRVRYPAAPRCIATIGCGTASCAGPNSASLQGLPRQARLRAPRAPVIGAFRRARDAGRGGRTDWFRRLCRVCETGRAGARRKASKAPFLLRLSNSGENLCACAETNH